MKRWIAMLFALVFTAALVPEEAEARRLGGSKPVGVQRQVTPQQPATAPAAQKQTAQQQPAASAARPRSPWLGALVGLAAGLGLAALFGEELGAVVMALLMAVAGIALIGLLLRAFGRGQPSQAAPQRLQYAGLGSETVAAPPPSQVAAGETLPDFRGQFAAKIPAGFNVDAFVREAKKRFIGLQAANDRGDLAAIRDFVTDEMYAHLEREVRERGAVQHTDVVELNAELLEVVSEGDTHWASIRFSGLIREDASAGPQQFEEIWNLQKTAGGDAGWLLAGIQQVG
jgi:predicted lipid-binding transport protein (Tim44 family)